MPGERQRAGLGQRCAAGLVHVGQRHRAVPAVHVVLQRRVGRIDARAEDRHDELRNALLERDVDRAAQHVEPVGQVQHGSVEIADRDPGPEQVLAVDVEHVGRWRLRPAAVDLVVVHAAFRRAECIADGVAGDARVHDFAVDRRAGSAVGRHPERERVVGQRGDGVAVRALPPVHLAQPCLDHVLEAIGAREGHVGVLQGPEPGIECSEANGLRLLVTHRGPARARFEQRHRRQVEGQFLASLHQHGRGSRCRSGGGQANGPCQSLQGSRHRGVRHRSLHRNCDDHSPAGGGDRHRSQRHHPLRQRRLRGDVRVCTRCPTSTGR